MEQFKKSLDRKIEVGDVVRITVENPTDDTSILVLGEYGTVAALDGDTYAEVALRTPKGPTTHVALSQLELYGKSLYGAVVERGIPYSSHRSDLYVPNIPEVRQLIDAFQLAGHPPGKNCIELFTNNVTHEPYLNVFFEYKPFWDAAQAESERRRAHLPKST
jgi:hypothetical protein